MKRILIFIVTSILLIGCQNGPLDPLREHFAEFGYSIFDTPRAFNGPGTIIRIDEDGFERIVLSAKEPFPPNPDGSDGEEERNAAEALFIPNDEVKVTSGVKRVPDYNGLSKLDVKACGHLVKVPLKFKGEYTKVKQVIIKFGIFEGEVISELPLKTWFNKHPHTHQLIADAIVITEAIKTARMEYQFLDSTGAKLKIEPENLPDIIGDASLNGEWKAKDEYTLEFNSPSNPLYIAYKGLKISRLVGTAHSPDDSKVDLKPIDLKKLKHLLFNKQ